MILYRHNLQYQSLWALCFNCLSLCLVFLICALDPGPWDWVEGPSRPVRLRPRPGSTDPGPGHSLLRISCDGGKERLTKLCAGPGSGGPVQARSQAGLIVLDPVPQNGPAHKSKTPGKSDLCAQPGPMEPELESSKRIRAHNQAGLIMSLTHSHRPGSSARVVVNTNI